MKRLLPFAAVVPFLASGCVSATKYREQQAETLEYQQKASTLAEELDAVKKANAKLESEVDAARKKAAELAQAVSDGAAKDIEAITAIVRRLDEMIEAKRALQKSAGSADDDSPKSQAAAVPSAAAHDAPTK